MKKVTTEWVLNAKLQGPTGIFLLFLFVCPCITLKSEENAICRDRMDFFHPKDFRISTCSMCFIYLFPEVSRVKQGVVNNTAFLIYLYITNKTLQSNASTTRSIEINDSVVRLIKVMPDIQEEDEYFQIICKELSGNKCQRWRQCCKDASECCQTQLQEHSHKPQATSKGNECPMTWDGYSCVDQTPRGQEAKVSCPQFYLEYKIDPGAQGRRKCQKNGSWWVSPVSGMEWTDYTNCIRFDTRSLEVAKLVAIVCNCLSLALLLPAVVIFLGLRVLRVQRRIQLHLCLFISLLFSSLFSILWERLVIFDMLVSPVWNNFEHSYPNWCRFLNITTRLAKTCNFFWMFNEGLHLYWLMVRALQPIKSNIPFLFIGWALPFLLIVSYIIVLRIIYNDYPCWIADTGNLEWLIDGPTIACIVVNLGFLLVIMRSLLLQLHAHSDNAGSFRRAFRALFILIPLFGLQQFCIIYRPSITAKGYAVYDIFSAIVVNSQGGVVALLLCYLNKEVRTQIKGVIKLINWKELITPSSSRRQSSISLTVTTSTHRRSVDILEGLDRQTKLTTIPEQEQGVAPVLQDTDPSRYMTYDSLEKENEEGNLQITEPNKDDQFEKIETNCMKVNYSDDYLCGVNFSFKNDK